MNEFKISNSSDHSGFKIYKLNDTHARCLSKKNLVDIYLTKRSDNKVYINGEFIIDEFHSFTADLDLFNYNNGLRFTAKKTAFMNINNIYAFRINKETANNYYTAYDYKETNIIKFIGYYDKDNDYILFLYQTASNIKYFTLKNNEDLYNFGSYSKIIQMKTNEHIEYNVNELIENFTNFGNLNVVQITKNLSGLITYENFGIDFYDFLINDNIFIPEESNKTWYLYNLSFIEHINNNITRIYFLKNVNIIINTCFSFDCISCLNDYNACDACIDSMALLSDELTKCYHIDKLIKGYIYNEGKNLFEKCFNSCDFCYATSINESEHNCESCAEGYLFSYQYKGNCYKINDLQIDEEKKVENINNENYISSACSLYKIYQTGECVNECPTSDIYFSFEYDSNSSNYIRTSIEPPKYSFNKICYDKCPQNLNTDEINKVCKCRKTFHLENSEIKCDDSEDCIYPYSYKNLNTNQCYSSLEECPFYFNDYCYNECPNDRISLYTQNETIRNYFVENLSLNDSLKDKLCICNIVDGVWNLINNTNDYYQECLNECPNGYEPESVAKQCVRENEQFTTENTEVTYEIFF